MKKIVFLLLFANLFAKWLPFSKLSTTHGTDFSLKSQLEFIHNTNIYFQIFNVKNDLSSDDITSIILSEKPTFADIGITLNNGAILAASNETQLKKAHRLLQTENYNLILKVKERMHQEETRFVTTNKIDLDIFNQQFNKSYLYISSTDTRDKLHEIISRKLNTVNISLDSQEILLNQHLLNTKLNFLLINQTRQQVTYQSRVNNTIIFVDPQSENYKIEEIKAGSTLFYKSLDGLLSINKASFVEQDLQLNVSELEGSLMAPIDLKHLSVYICDNSQTHASISCMFVGFTDNMPHGDYYNIYTPLIIKDDIESKNLMQEPYNAPTAAIRN